MNEHRQIQRYFLNGVHTGNAMLPAATNPSLTEPNGDWVLYAEHAAALRACEQRVQADLEDEINLYRRHANEAYQRGLNAAREAVKHLQHSDDCYYAEGVLCHCEIKRVITAIDALRKEPQ
jgi:hypothetical protein